MNDPDSDVVDMMEDENGVWRDGPTLYFVVTELLAAVLCTAAFFYFDVMSYVRAFWAWVGL